MSVKAQTINREAWVAVRSPPFMKCLTCATGEFPYADKLLSPYSFLIEKSRLEEER